MAQMFPPEVAASTRSNAERALFDTIRNELADDWTVLHSLPLARHARKVWAEIDFVLIGSPGIYCLEVKGGRVRRENGIWYFTNAAGDVAHSREGPFEQCQSAAQALRSYLLANLPWIHEAVVGYGVVFPDIEFAATGPEIEPRILYDNRDRAVSFASYTRRLADHWHETLERRRGRPVSALTSAQVRAVFDALRGDFDLRPSLRMRVGQAADELLYLTHEQYAALDRLRENPRMIISGGAGTGKTLIAVEEARREARAGRRVFFACFNRHLADYLRLSVADIPEIDVWHLHGYMREIIGRAGIEHLLPAAQPEDLFTIFFPEVAGEALLRLDLLEHYDVLILDEGQDLLLDTYLEFYDLLLEGGLDNGTWRIFRDPNQDLFSATATAALRTIEEYRPVAYPLTVNCRNTKPVAIANRSVTGLGSDTTLKVSGPDVEYLWYRDRAHQVREISRAVNRLLGSGFSPDELMILSRYRLEKGGLSSGLIGVPFPLTTDLDAEGSIRYATVSAFKGLESDVIIFADVDDLSDRAALLNFYVGASRARAYLVLSLAEANRDIYLERVHEFAQFLAGEGFSSPGSSLE